MIHLCSSDQKTANLTAGASTARERRYVIGLHPRAYCANGFVPS